MYSSNTVCFQVLTNSAFPPEWKTKFHNLT